MSTARTPRPRSLPDALFQLGESAAPLGAFGERCFVQISGRVPTCTADDDVLAVFVPLQNRARANAKAASYFQGD